MSQKREECRKITRGLFFSNIFTHCSIVVLHLTFLIHISVFLKPSNEIISRLAAMGKNRRTRPWSAHESRFSADPVFHMRQRHWEGLIAGKKHLHRGQLLPGSTSSEDDPSGSGSGIRPPPTCWSECSSPRKQVRISELPLRRRVLGGPSDPQNPMPLIQAIKDELQRFHRAPNLTGISIINDPDLLQKESAT